MSTDEEALLAAIEATPLDNAPRLIYADWLQERGNEVRAEYLRAVVALLNPPEDEPIVDRLMEIAPTIDGNWRHRVGARFEVSLDGKGADFAISSLFGVALNWQFFANVQLSETGKPVLLKSGLTREGAVDFVNSIVRDIPLRELREKLFRFIIAPMKVESSIGFFP